MNCGDGASADSEHGDVCGRAADKAQEHSAYSDMGKNVLTFLFA